MCIYNFTFYQLNRSIVFFPKNLFFDQQELTCICIDYSQLDFYRERDKSIGGILFQSLANWVNTTTTDSNLSSPVNFIVMTNSDPCRTRTEIACAVLFSCWRVQNTKININLAKPKTSHRCESLIRTMEKKKRKRFGIVFFKPSHYSRIVISYKLQIHSFIHSHVKDIFSISSSSCSISYLL